MTDLVLLGVLRAAAHDPVRDGELGGEVVARLPIPVRRPTRGDAAFCFSVSPSLGTPDTVIDAGGIEVRCGSTWTHTVVCLRIPEDTPWPDTFWETTCQGDGHVLQARFVPGHDPDDDPADGLDVVRIGGPIQVSRDRAVSFRVPGWPDALGTMPDGACEVRGGRLTLLFTEPLLRQRIHCRLPAPIGRRIPIRLRSPGWRERAEP